MVTDTTNKLKLHINSSIFVSLKNRFFLNIFQKNKDETYRKKYYCIIFHLYFLEKYSKIRGTKTE